MNLNIDLAIKLAGEKKRVIYAFKHSKNILINTRMASLDDTVNNILYSSAHYTGQLLHGNFKFRQPPAIFYIINKLILLQLPLIGLNVFIVLREKHICKSINLVCT